MKMELDPKIVAGIIALVLVGVGIWGYSATQKPSYVPSPGANASYPGGAPGTPGAVAYPGGAYPGGAYPGGAYPGGAYPGGAYPGGAPTPGSTAR